jgi:hypothetical protein
MFNKTKKVLIGKNIAWTVTDGLILHSTGDAGVNKVAADGEIIVFDKDKKVMAAGKTISDTDTIYIGQACADTYSYTEEGGTAVTSARKILFSDPIEGRLVKSYKGKSYTAKAEQITHIDGSTTLIVTAGTPLVLRIIYKDMQEQKGGAQFVHSYRYTCPNPAISITATLTALAAVVNAHAGRRVIASMSGTELVLTGLAIPSCTTGLNDIDNFSMVEFDAILCYVDSDGYFAHTAAVDPAITVKATYGCGIWELVRDAEKEARGNRGVTNLTRFPVITPEWSTVKSTTYDQVIIEHDKSYVSSDNQYTKQAPLKTIIYFYKDSAQTATVLARLNPWMASLPQAFTGVAV